MFCRWNIFVFIYFDISYIFLCSAHCNRGFFRVGQMTECHPWLSCHDMKFLDFGELIGFGAVKQVYKSVWQNDTIAIVYINNNDYLTDFLHGFEMLKELGPSSHIVQLVGFCLESKVYLTEYHPLGDSRNIHSALIAHNITSLRKRFELCIDYVKIIAFLHDSPLGKRVMCDSSSLNKTLEQYLITSSLNLIVNDLDALPQVGPRGITCGHKELQGSFIAPEQKWPYPGVQYEEHTMPPYTEKVDIWKIPPVCNYFLGKSAAAQVFRYHVHPIHRQCRNKLPQNRPAAGEVLIFYEKLFADYFKDETRQIKDEF